MFKLATILLVFLAQANAQQTADEKMASLVQLGFSQEAANGIVSLGDKEQAKYAAVNPNDGDVNEKTERIMKESKTELENFIKTQSASDQAAYEAAIKKAAEKDSH